MKLLVAGLLAIALVGCSPEVPPAEPEPQPTVDKPVEPEPPKSAVYDQLHSALFQADAALSKVREALDALQQVHSKNPPEIAEDLKDMAATLDDTGATLADRVGEELPPIEEVAKDEPKFKGKVTELRGMIDDVLVDLREQEGVAASLVEMGP